MVTSTKLGVTTSLNESIGRVPGPMIVIPEKESKEGRKPSLKSPSSSLLLFLLVMLVL